MVEGLNFVRSILYNFPEIINNFHLLLILQVEPQQFEITKKALKEFQGLLKTDSASVCISFEINIERNDKDQNEFKTWINQFKNMLLKHKKVPACIKLRILMVSFVHA
jgi:hypothetical protein